MKQEHFEMLFDVVIDMRVILERALDELKALDEQGARVRKIVIDNGDVELLTEEQLEIASEEMDKLTQTMKDLDSFLDIL